MKLSQFIFNKKHPNPSNPLHLKTYDDVVLNNKK